MYEEKVMLLKNRFQDLLNETAAFEYLSEYNPAGYPNQRAVFIRGEKHLGKDTGAFAYVGFPDESHCEDAIPAVVLVHGGGGYAFPQWIQKWNDEGYAAIAFCHTGHRPAKKDITDFYSEDSWTREDVLGPWASGPDNDSLTSAHKDFNEQWIYHAVSLTIIAHNYFRLDKRVDKNKIGLCGISWGSVVASIVMRYDTRLAFAVPVYGSGYLSDGIGWVQKLFYNESAKTLWDSRECLSKICTPVLWLCWANDPAFSIHSNVKSYEQTPKSEISIQQNISHGHPEGWNLSEIYRFANAVTKGGEPLVKCTEEPKLNADNCLEVSIKIPSDAEQIKARLIYLTEAMTYSQNGVIKWDGCDTIDQTWKSCDCRVENNCVYAEISEEAHIFYIEFTAVCAGEKFVSSTPFVSS